MKRLLFIGDSITDADRDRKTDDLPQSYGRGFVFLTESELARRNPNQYRIFNRGIGGNNISELYARIKMDCWALQPNVITVTMGINDVCFEKYTKNPNGVEIGRFDRIYRMMIEDTLAQCGNIPMILIQPFILPISDDRTLFDEFLSKVREYAEAVEKIGLTYGFPTISLQSIFENYAEKFGSRFVLYDGTHPTVFGAKLIAEEWLKIFEREIEKRIQC